MKAWPWVVSLADPPPELTPSLRAVWEHIKSDPRRLKKFRARVHGALDQCEVDVLAAVGVILGVKPQ